MQPAKKPTTRPGPNRACGDPPAPRRRRPNCAASFSVTRLGSPHCFTVKGSPNGSSAPAQTAVAVRERGALAPRGPAGRRPRSCGVVWSFRGRSHTATIQRSAGSEARGCADPLDVARAVPKPTPLSSLGATPLTGCLRPESLGKSAVKPIVLPPSPLSVRGEGRPFGPCRTSRIPSPRSSGGALPYATPSLTRCNRTSNPGRRVPRGDALYIFNFSGLPPESEPL